MLYKYIYIQTVEITLTEHICPHLSLFSYLKALFKQFIVGTVFS